MQSRELNRPRRRCQGTRALLVLGALLVADVAGGRVLDRVVALVDGRVLSWSQLDFEARVMLIDRGGVEAATAPLDASTIQNALDLAIAQRAATAEADKLNSYPVEPAEIDQRLRTFESRFPSAAAFQSFLKAHDADRASLAEVLARAVRTEKFVEGRVRLRSQVPESEVRKAWEADHGGRTWEEARGRLRERMQRERAYVLAREALAQLRSSIPVRIIARPEELAREQLGLGEAAR
ncbi:MAG: hypothetical protein EHM78_00375 [Myxococcaceae bacterium]|nr:MAG: hypothetical protein EHM78_00375 [Myxococcaceae bacterium]